MTTAAQYDVPFGEELPDVELVPWADPTDYDEIPHDLDSIEPGLIMAAVLSAIDVSKVSPHDQVIVLRANDRMMSHFGAQRYRDIAAVHRTYASAEDCTYTEAGAVSSAEIRLALTLTRRAADNELAFALSLEHRLPRLLDMLVAGTIDVHRARTIERATVHLSDATAQNVLDQIADQAANLTTGQLGARIRNLCIEADPEEAKDRYDTAHDARNSLWQHDRFDDLPPCRSHREGGVRLVVDCEKGPCYHPARPAQRRDFRASWKPVS